MNNHFLQSRNARVIAAIAAAVLVLAVLILRGGKSGPETEQAPPAERRSVAMSAEAIAGAGIEVRQAGPATLAQDFKLPGSMALNAETVAHVVPRLSGQAREVLVHLGDRVKKGEVLAVFDSEQLANLRGEWLTARDEAQLAKLRYQREESLWKQKISAEQDYLAAKQTWQEADIRSRAAAQKLEALQLPLSGAASLTRYELRAPIAGEIVERDVALGEPIPADKRVFVIAELSTVWAEFQVPAQYLGQVTEGQIATVSLAGSELSGSGPVAHVSSVLNEDTKAAHAHLVLANPDRRWHPGAFVDITLAGPRREVAIAVPPDALQTVNGKPSVFVRTAAGFDARDVVAGERDAKLVEIRDGLKAGEPYAASAYRLKAELEKSTEE